ncbi:hypothetical protein BGZ83_001373, partial [Gryganskiella cystojenkinii]
MILAWGSDGIVPDVSAITAINFTLYCNAGPTIAQVTPSTLAGPYNWTVPSVGNATTVGGTIGVCADNAFHIEYSGMAKQLLGVIMPWGPVRCGGITILPAPNGTFTTTTTTMPATSTSTSTSPTTTPTDTADTGSGGGISTTVLIVIAA